MVAMEELKHGVSTDSKGVFPYSINRDLLPADFLVRLYDDLLLDGVAAQLFHEVLPDKQAFVEFVERECILSVFIDLARNQYDGVAWLTQICETDTLRRGCGSFAFFRRAWDPALTRLYGRLCLEQWFHYFGFDLIWGQTPKPNRLARVFCTRLGFKYVAEIPDFTTYGGKTVAACICTMTRKEFEDGKGSGQEGVGG